MNVKRQIFVQDTLSVQNAIYEYLAETCAGYISRARRTLKAWNFIYRSTAGVLELFRRQVRFDFERAASPVDFVAAHGGNPYGERQEFTHKPHLDPAEKWSFQWWEVVSSEPFWRVFEASNVIDQCVVLAVVGEDPYCEMKCKIFPVEPLVEEKCRNGISSVHPTNDGFGGGFDQCGRKHHILAHAEPPHSSFGVIADGVVCSTERLNHYIGRESGTAINIFP